MNVSESRRSQSEREGEEAENLFKLICEQKNISIEKVSGEKNKYKHIDFRFMPKDKWRTVDVKALKRISGKDDDVSITHQWLEFFGIKGYRGWLLGMARYIAFMMEDKSGFYMCPRKKLIEWATSHFGMSFNGSHTALTRQIEDKCLWVTDPYIAEYKFYKHNEKDIITLVEMSVIHDINIKELRLNV